MAITTYSGLLTELTRLIDGEDISGSEIPTLTLAQIVYLGELRLYRDIRTRWNEKAWGITTTSNVATLPSDFEAPSVVHFGGKPMDPVAEDWLLDYLNNNPSGGESKYFAKAGDGLMFAPAATDGTTVQGRYYYRLPALSDSTLSSNGLFAVAEDLFLYAALTESAPFFGQDARIPLWNAKYMSIRDALNLNDSRAAMTGRIQRRPSTRLMR